MLIFATDDPLAPYILAANGHRASARACRLFQHTLSVVGYEAGHERGVKSRCAAEGATGIDGRRARASLARGSEIKATRRSLLGCLQCLGCVNVLLMHVNAYRRTD